MARRLSTRTILANSSDVAETETETSSLKSSQNLAGATPDGTKKMSTMMTLQSEWQKIAAGAKP